MIYGEFYVADTKERHETHEGEAGVRLLFNIVDPTGMLTSSNASEMALQGLATIVANSLSTHENLLK